jgi:CAAX prenyl protease-like protein
MVVFLMGNMFGGYLEQHRVHLLEEERAWEQAARESGTDVARDDERHAGESKLPAAVTRWFGHWFPLEQTWYPSTYTLTVLLTTVIVLIGMPGYLRTPGRLTWWGPAVGTVGILVWIGLWYVDSRIFGVGQWLVPLLGGSRAAFNPFEVLRDTPGWMYQFLAIRLFGMVLLVPLIEEFFLRGFLMRYIEDPDWDQIPLGAATWKAVAGVLVYAAISHPAEIFAAVAWFGMVTWMYLRTRSLWDCVVAHAVTNLLLAIFVISTRTWELW